MHDFVNPFPYLAPDPSMCSSPTVNAELHVNESKQNKSTWHTGNSLPKCKCRVLKVLDDAHVAPSNQSDTDSIIISFHLKIAKRR